VADLQYPHAPGHKGRSDTGAAAAVLFAPKAKPIRERTLAIIERGPATAEQIADEIGEHFTVVRPRLSEARKLGLVVDSGLRGTGALGGTVVVWRLATLEEREIFVARNEG
jgi:predicted ArsR family transcriptional regulator